MRRGGSTSRLPSVSVSSTSVTSLRTPATDMPGSLPFAVEKLEVPLERPLALPAQADLALQPFDLGRVQHLVGLSRGVVLVRLTLRALLELDRHGLERLELRADHRRLVGAHAGE